MPPAEQQRSGVDRRPTIFSQLSAAATSKATRASSFADPKTSHPLRLALIDERAAAAEAAASAIAEVHAEAGHREVLPVVSPKWTECPSPTSRWGTLDVIQRVVEEGLSASDLARGRPLLPVPVEFPQDYNQTVRFCRPENKGLQTSWSDSCLDCSQRSGIGSQAPESPVSFDRWCKSQSDFSFSPKHGPRVLGELGWSRPSLKATPQTRTDPSRAQGKRNAVVSEAALSSDSLTRRSSNLHSPSGSEGSSEGASEGSSSEAPSPPGRAEFVRTCWTRSRVLLKHSWAQVADSPHVK
mmetsp:Transcript_47008/g.151030  ORF Transcript_47008/g.151030 Transcript_47008/m.151030 type:complete len:297 (+) Transcript_47008:174-1064(+)